MSSDFLEWLKEHKDEYGVKIIENPTEEQKMQFARDFQEVIDFIQLMKKFCPLNFQFIGKIITVC